MFTDAPCNINHIKGKECSLTEELIFLVVTKKLTRNIRNMQLFFVIGVLLIMINNHGGRFLLIKVDGVEENNTPENRGILFY